MLSAMLLGLVSSLHCIAMCGPIAMMLRVDHHHPEKKAIQIMAYHLGRISSYSLLGLLFGLLGRGLYLAGIQQRLSIIAGIIMILIAVLPERIFSKYNLSGPVFRIVAKTKTLMGLHLGNPSFSSLYMVGILNGLLPCAMVYAALFGALATQQVLYGTVYMALFGIGTVPLMSMVIYVQKWATLRVRNKIRKVIPYTMVVIGVLFILRGLSLNIAHVSPSGLNLFVMAAPNCK